MAREVWVEMLRILNFATNSLRSDVRVILQYSVITSPKSYARIAKFVPLLTCNANVAGLNPCEDLLTDSCFPFCL